MAYTLLAIGPANPDADSAWLETGAVSRVIRQPSLAVGGKRLNSRIWGIGLDSLLLALRTIGVGARGPYLANNPWIGAALRLTGRSDFVVTGIYAEPGSKSWKILRTLIGHRLVITLSVSEAKAWNADGGHAIPVLYGNRFGYSEEPSSQPFHIFVGGSSDRDPSLIKILEEEVLGCKDAVALTLAIGGEPGLVKRGKNSIRRTGFLDQSNFGRLLAKSDIAFLPLNSGIRAAGHMVLAGALECGVPVGATPTEGMKEYIFGPSLKICDPSLPIIPQLRQIAAQAPPKDVTIEFWREHFSLDCYVRRVATLISSKNGSA